MTQMVRVGIPRALSYYRYFPMWKVLLEGLGAEVVVSRPTNKDLLEEGVRNCVDDICVPVKLYYGHLLDLKEEVDYIFVQRLVSVEGIEDTYTCPKLIGLPDMIKSSLSGIPPQIEFRVDLKKRSLKYTAGHIAEQLGASGSSARRALKAALEVQDRFEEELLAGLLPDEAMEKVLTNGSGRAPSEAPSGHVGPGINVAVVGHEYLVHDRFISHDLPRRLKNLGVNATYATEVPQKILDRELARYPEISWSYEKVLLGASSYFLGRPDIHGVMMVMGFACGPDSIISEIINREVKGEDSAPFMTLVLDEHTGEAGIATRVEAFVDLIRRSLRR